MEERSEIQSFYKGKTIFITGGSGFMGKVLIEKLLFACSDLDKIYMLIRSKRGRTPDSRMDEMFKLPVGFYFFIFFGLIYLRTFTILCYFYKEERTKIFERMRYFSCSLECANKGLKL